MPKTPGKPRAQGDKPKKRWTAEQKQARDAKAPAKGPKGAKGPKVGKLKPRRDYEPRTDRDPSRHAGDAPRGARATERDRPAATPRWQRADDRPYDSRDSRRPDDRFAGRGAGGFRRDDRPNERADRFDRPERPRWGDRNDRPDRERPVRSDRWEGRDAPRADRPPYARDREWERPSRPYSERPRSTDSRPDRPRQASRPGDRAPRRFDDRGPRDRYEPRAERYEPRGERYESRPPRDRGGYDDRAPRRFDDRGPRSYDERPGRGRYDDRHDDRGRDRYDRRSEPQASEPDHMEWTARSQDRPQEQVRTGFSDLGLPEALVTALAAEGITEPFPIQAATIADALAGRDVLGRAKTGSGKTLGFGLPLLTRLSEDTSGIGTRAVILVPTRELALQVADVLAPLAQSVGLTTALVAGGMAYGPQLRAFERGVDVVVATPGRLIDLMEQGAADLSQVVVTVLDEADHMADLGFWPAVATIVDATPRDGQRLLFSATLDEAIDALVKRYLTNPVTHEVDPDKASVGTMTHAFWLVAPHHKNAVAARLAGRGGRALVFVRTQMGADRVAVQLREAGVLAGALHGGLTQGARSRILAAFRDGHLPVLVATDVAARGIHVDDVSLVLQLDPPMTHKDYLHRAGRTARAGESGTVVSIVLPHQRKTVLRLAGMAGAKPKLEQVDPESEIVTDIAGVETEKAAVPEDEYAALIAPKPTAPRRPRPAFRPYRGSRR
jgi:superfamily II DNA/RNA helicase